MKHCTVRLRNMPGSPYSQSRHIDVEKGPKESHNDFEKRTWATRIHSDDEGVAFIPPMALIECIKAAAQYLSKKIPGKRNATYTKHFRAGLTLAEGPSLGIKASDVPGEWLFVNADGKKGGGVRVMRCFPKFATWDVEVKFVVLDDTITEDVFLEHLIEAGKFVGIGRFRPEKGGYYGRFVVVSHQWKEIDSL